ncbi:hypothetical protein [Pseudomonas sp. PLMAX]|uniref:hypothetical protein n=1 Tax=Pseudomonas sp. PLMAX TaxID=2201998 RepID=UPI0038BC36CD
MTPEQKIEALRAEFEERFKLDIWPVVEWLRNKGAVHINAPEAGISPDFMLPCEIKLPPATTIGKGCRLKTLMLALALEGRPERFDIPPTPEEEELGNSLRALIESTHGA